MDEPERAATLRRLLADPDKLDATPDDLSEDVSEGARHLRPDAGGQGRVLGDADRDVRPEHGPPRERRALRAVARASGPACSRVDDDGNCTANHLSVSPLFETVDDLEQAPDVLRALLEDPFYRSSLSTGAGCRRSCSATATRARTPATSRATGPSTRCRASWPPSPGSTACASGCSTAAAGSAGRGGGPSYRAIMAQPRGHARRKHQDHRARGGDLLQVQHARPRPPQPGHRAGRRTRSDRRPVPPDPEPRVDRGDGGALRHRQGGLPVAGLRGRGLPPLLLRGLSHRRARGR